MADGLVAVFALAIAVAETYAAGGLDNGGRGWRLVQLAAEVSTGVILFCKVAL